MFKFRIHLSLPVDFCLMYDLTLSALIITFYLAVLEKGKILKNGDFCEFLEFQIPFENVYLAHQELISKYLS